MRRLAVRTLILTISLMACSSDVVGPSPDQESKTASAFPAPSPGGAPTVTGVWINRDVIAARPVSGTPWAAVEGAARQSCGRIDLGNQDSTANVCVLAKALVAARTGSVSARTEVIAALADLVGVSYQGRALSLGRELAAYVIAADLIDLASADPGLNERFKRAISGLLTTRTSEGPVNLIDCHETRPNNWGTMCGASRAAVASYLHDSDALARVAQVFHGWLGDRSSYSSFKFGDLSWQCDSSSPVAINPPGCLRNGRSIDGVLPDDQRRAGPFAWPPPKENYVYEALQGAVVQAVILTQSGYPAFEWENQAMLRAFRWLYSEASFPAGGDDAWIVPLINHYYGTTYPVQASGKPGKVMAWAEWTHER